MINRKTVIVLEVLQSKDIPDILDKVAGRIYTLDGVEDVTAQLAGEFERHGDKFVRVDVEQMGT